MKKTKQIGVIGAGLMGHGIALTMARAGYQVIVSDPDAATRKSCKSRITDSMQAMSCTETDVIESTARISVCESIGEAVEGATFVFEAAPEKLALKQDIFKQIEALAPADAVLASNTSVIQITLIMQNLDLRERALGTHWWNPPHLIPLVEVIKTQWTHDEVAQSMMELLHEVGKTPVLVEKDVPGFIGNRLQHALWREAISLVENGVCDAAAVDTVIRSSFGRRLAVLGPLENADLVGTDLTLDIHENVLFDLESRQGPSPYLEKLVADGKLGMKSGEGFRRWSTEDAQASRDRVNQHLQRLEKILPD
ncbi:3-hydroxyacyl-CoA dehydrogenase family protein [Granulosicoccus antarcticus]|uniref:Putative 3-hydroxybutyryl-CoA dehydrogenase n=1 Tax=Granulosicoccus antarcticus IMCC3135 TaxID=1192854 RepID=A0A2Z2NUN2_9GAMM|nr:3-hydroxyacyl-CoA dehydrogenase NAD-binding domain-containing protein [Granulosicoccus antarcticus]ASJ73731.1 putative 3-hydroxybutyryl-CoA dehydrogenase [Granulosicoccus antarcticus IMCC3135]